MFFLALIVSLIPIIAGGYTLYQGTNNTLGWILVGVGVLLLVLITIFYSSKRKGNQKLASWTDNLPDCDDMDCDGPDCGD